MGDPQSPDLALRDHIALMVLPWSVVLGRRTGAANRKAAITGSARNAYMLADAMMEARAQSKGDGT